MIHGSVHLRIFRAVSACGRFVQVNDLVQLDTLSSSLFYKEKLTMRGLKQFTKIDKSYCWEAIRQKSLIVNWLNLSNVCYSNKLIYSSIYIGILVLKLCVCAVRRKVQTVLFTGFRKKVNVVLGIR